DQRNIIEEVTHKPASATPQLWALYKEVQDYYDKGMRVPDDVTLLLCDDNWGNIRKLPRPDDAKRKGGYGIYYHFDYVGGPRNYKWINTNNISRVWEQMHLAYAHGVDRIWIVNVGDIKPMELPISFFLDYAWNPGKWNENNIHRYYAEWARKQFGEPYQVEIGNILRTYSQYASRKKPELLDDKTYSIFNYNEADEVVQSWRELLEKAKSIQEKLPASARDAFFQLVLHPIWAMANLHEMYAAAARNNYYAMFHLKEANVQADEVKRLYLEDARITSEYHHIAGGKWNHMMDQTHIGYFMWQQPPENKMPDVVRVPDSLLVDSGGLVSVSSPAPTANELVSFGAKEKLFTEADGCVSMEAAHWTKAVSTNEIKWKIIPDIGKTGDGVTTFPVMAQAKLSPSSPDLDYEFYTYDTGAFNLRLYFSPTLNIYGDEGLKYAVSFDDGPLQVQILNEGEKNVRTWEKWVADNIIIKNLPYRFAQKGKHLLHFWMISPAVVLQKIVIDFGGAKPSYLGPPETKY
ncbi:MAG: glycosyl hydrolase 115 family protein, partial [Flavisolibacter sp.]